MVRNPDRIPEVLDAIEARWRESPDMRLGQLLWAIAGGDPFGMEDTELMRRLDEELEVEYFIGESPWETFKEESRERTQRVLDERERSDEENKS